MRTPDTTDGGFDVAGADFAREVADAVHTQGFAIVPGVIDRARCDELIDEVDRVEKACGITFGTNDFEGFRTRRIFNLIQRSSLFRDLVLHEKVLAIVEALLGPDFLLSGTTSMHISPGETEQLLHADDGMITLPRPHVPTLVTTLWALGDFLEENGATRVVPGSHRLETMPKPGESHASMAAVMPAGSVLILHGSTWHGGGANRTDDGEQKTTQNESSDREDTPLSSPIRQITGVMT